MKKIVLLTFALVSLSTVLSLFVVGLLELQIAYASPYASIDVDTAYNMITNGSYPDLVILDVRTQSEYDSGHIYGAVWIPHTELMARINELAGHKNHEIIVYCKAGGRSAAASSILDFYNFTKVNNMLEGMDAWQSAGYPVYIATVHNVNTTFNYDTIQAAINAPETLDGHTILVDAGTYYEHVTINKSLSLVGENRSTTVIDGRGEVAVVSVAENNVNLTGFTIQNGVDGITIDYFGSAIIRENYITGNRDGISLYFSHMNIFSENNVTGNGYGVWLGFSGDNIFRTNNIVDNAWQALIVEGNKLYDFIQDMDTSNKVNGKPVYYWVNERNRTVPHDAGYIAAVNSTNITIRNLTVERSGQGVLLANTTNSVVERTNLTSNHFGIYLCCSTNITINRNNITDNNMGIDLFLSNENNITGNAITKNAYGIDVGRSEGNKISGNTITDQTANDNSWGISLWLSENNLIAKNNIINNKRGIELFKSENNLIYHNNFLNNAKQVRSYDSLINTWDDGYVYGYLSGGNYWDDYGEIDGDGNGIGDTPYVIDANNADRYPLVVPLGPIPIVWDGMIFPVELNGNSTISRFRFDASQRMISFNVTGPTGIIGFCNISIPEDLLWGDFSVYLDEALLVEVVDYTKTYNGTHNIFSITYNHSSHIIEITGTYAIPEYSSWIIPTLLLVATLVIVIYKKKPFHQRSKET